MHNLALMENVYIKQHVANTVDAKQRKRGIMVMQILVDSIFIIPLNASSMPPIY